MPFMRSFLGIEIPERIRVKCKEIQAEVRNINVDVKFVKKKNLHWTVKFLGKISDEKIPKIDSSLNKISINPFQIEIKGTDAFPSFNYIKNFWIGVGEGKENFIKLLKEVERSLVKRGFRKDKHEPTPHITLGRVKSGKNKEKLVNTLKRYKNKKLGEMKIKKITLYKSKLKGKGPIYTKIKQYKLD